ncbi:hypothetical protein G4974_02160 [[Ruminococcus] gnavus]|uniref:Uncharacterized protein n=1 Tax=Mediterraneibacter gnavus TaxID=33038 RepID=A0AAJ1AWR2_MEDGN|nr:hypothetical protein [Mediterraneibacter gnavus]MCC3675435.1 hypothetical protein [[Clostridium] nexile]MCB5492692.1 hypothetical protein [Mediterraneibacter gnavus]MCB5592312.1 hypothetical protein [Mediterraneibacter gnavus]MCB5605117.1 hypothetical protein [Mediterraneibacter gnavus]MCG4522110.1 hypothetical protein [Mediterraneibacter gnavus]
MEKLFLFFVLKFKKAEHEKEDRVVDFVRWRKGEDTQNFIISKQGINAPTNVGISIRLLAVYTGASPLRPPFVFPDTALIFPNNNTNFL